MFKSCLVTPMNTAIRKSIQIKNEANCDHFEVLEFRDLWFEETYSICYFYFKTLVVAENPPAGNLSKIFLKWPPNLSKFN